ncbi:signal transduction histidine kinase [Mobilisporobacter senegalensis]|uniref:histidine kinase n=1 Tax=Mobilisporobacter senegalensis TaxID=1329262 RepID=A0A3N1XYZ2_9FIRM|nr:HAMP domain-containing sensor histidine kinase [Mobilisporobacter senegalensis]ROR31813.1 signal transduction histidine kinase [Mobilisporobacter senegalensis]
MKLWIKIFLSTLILSVATLSASIYFMINNTHLENVKREEERSLSELDAIELSILNSLDITTTSKETIKTVLSRFDDYYSQKDIHLILYQGQERIYNGLGTIDEADYKDLLTADENNKMAHIIENDSKHYILISTMISPDNNSILIYARNISYIYISRTQNIHLALTLTIIVTIILGLFSYLYSKWITSPLRILQKGAIKISQGDYSERIPKTKDEFNDLGIAFNNMAVAVETRTLELEDRANEKQTFIDDLAHEMNTPLTSIQGYSEFLLNVNTTNEQRLIAANSIHMEAKRMKEIYNKLMTLTLAREKQIDLSMVNLEELFNDLKDTFYHQLVEKKITFLSNIQIENITMDKTLIYILLSNLIKNSIQALPNRGTIQLSGYEENHKPVIEIWDNGHGIPADKINMVTMPFYRVDKSRSRKTGGAGLGLSICKNIAQLHGIELIIDSKEEIGTVIKINF